MQQSSMQQQQYRTPPASPVQWEDCPSSPSHVMDFELCKHTEKRRKRVRPRVTFAEDALLYSGHRTIADVKASWYTRDELGQFKAERKEVVRLLKKSNFDLSGLEAQGDVCLRGFEAYFSVQLNKTYKTARANVFTAVLEEQCRLKASPDTEERSKADSILRTVCCNASGWARTKALQLAMNDQAEAAQFYAQGAQVTATSQRGVDARLAL